MAAAQLPLPDMPKRLGDIDNSKVARTHQTLSAEREWIECMHRSDRRRWVYEVTAWRDWTGELGVTGNLASDEWIEELAPSE